MAPPSLEPKCRAQIMCVRALGMHLLARLPARGFRFRPICVLDLRIKVFVCNSSFRTLPNERDLGLGIKV